MKSRVFSPVCQAWAREIDSLGFLSSNGVGYRIQLEVTHNQEKCINYCKRLCYHLYITFMVGRPIFSSKTMYLTTQQDVWRNSSTEKNITVMEWPAQPPDTNIFENIWQVLKQQVQHKKPGNHYELGENILQA